MGDFLADSFPYPVGKIIKIIKNGLFTS